MHPADFYLRVSLDHIRACKQCTRAYSGLKDHPTPCPISRALRDLRTAWRRLAAAEAHGRRIARMSSLNTC